MTQASPGSAEDAYKKGDYSAAEKQYAETVGKDSKQPRLEFNLGSAAYKSADYAKAAAAFQNTLNTTEVPLQQSAYYNLGNTQFRLGQSTEKAKPQETINTWQDAVKSYDAALQIKSDDVGCEVQSRLCNEETGTSCRSRNSRNRDQQKKDQQNSGQSQNQSKPDQKEPRTARSKSAESERATEPPVRTGGSERRSAEIPG